MYVLLEKHHSNENMFSLKNNYQRCKILSIQSTFSNRWIYKYGEKGRNVVEKPQYFAFFMFLSLFNLGGETKTWVSMKICQFVGRW